MQAFAITAPGSTQVSKMDLPTPTPPGTEVLPTVTRSGVGHTDRDIPAVGASPDLSRVTHSLDRLSNGGVKGRIELKGSTQ